MYTSENSFTQPETGGLLPRILLITPLATLILVSAIFVGIPSIFENTSDRDWPWVVLFFIGLPATIVSAPAAFFCIRKKRRGAEAVKSCLLIGTFAGLIAFLLLTVGIACMVLATSRGNIITDIQFLIFIGLIGSGLVGLPIGFFFSLPFIPLMQNACTDPNSHDRISWLNRRAGRWLMVISVLSVLPFLMTILFNTNSSPQRGFLFFSLCGFGLLVGFAMWFRGFIHLRRKKQWLTTLGNDPEDEWQLRPFEEVHNEDKLDAVKNLRLLFHDDIKAIHTGRPYVLMHLVKDEKGPYRQGWQHLPIALVYK